MEFSYFSKIGDLKRGDIVLEIFKEVFRCFLQENTNSKTFEIKDFSLEEEGKKMLGVAISTGDKFYIDKKFEKSIKMEILCKKNPRRCYTIVVGPFKGNVYQNIFDVCISNGVVPDLEESEVPKQILSIRDQILLEFFVKVRTK